MRGNIQSYFVKVMCFFLKQVYIRANVSLVKLNFVSTNEIKIDVISKLGVSFSLKFDGQPEQIYKTSEFYSLNFISIEILMLL